MKNITFSMNMKHTFLLIFALKWVIISSNQISLPGCTPRVGNCEDLNELCEFIPLPHILCEQDKVKHGCPRLCNNCPVVSTFPSEQSTESNLEINMENLTGQNNTITFSRNYSENVSLTESGKHLIIF